MTDNASTDARADPKLAPVRALKLGACAVEVKKRADGSMLLHNPGTLSPYP